MEKKDLLSSIPAINDFLAAVKSKKIIANYSRRKFLKMLKSELEAIRNDILQENNLTNFDNERLDINKILLKVQKKLASEEKRTLKKVINAGGIIIHTNLGRSLLPQAAVDKVQEIAENYSNLEFDLASGKRGSRYKKIRKMLKDLTGAESALIVNNNAAAVMLVLTVIAKGQEVIISRGEMVEIGGSFRIPDVMESSGAILREVGSTNKVYLDDYLEAVNENTAAVLKVHTSNYRVRGFTHFVEAQEMVEAAHRNNLAVIEDLGSGILFDLSDYGLEYEPTVKEGIKAGIDLLTFSGDKLLGGPQAGIIVGKKNYISKIESHPLMRALRVDKMTLAGLEATLELYYNFEAALDNIPTLKLITEKKELVKKRAKKLITKIKDRKNIDLKLIKSKAKVGGGAYPLSSFASYAVEIDLKEQNIEKFIYKLRQLKIPIIGRIQNDKAIFDLKTVADSEIEELADSINEILSEVF